MSNVVAATPNAWAESFSAVPSFVSSVGSIFLIESRKLLNDSMKCVSRSVPSALGSLLFGEVFNHAATTDTGGIPYLAFRTPGIVV